jgi:hypothetical protein
MSETEQTTVTLNDTAKLSLSAPPTHDKITSIAPMLPPPRKKREESDSESSSEHHRVARSPSFTHTPGETNPDALLTRVIQTESALRIAMPFATAQASVGTHVNAALCEEMIGDIEVIPLDEDERDAMEGDGWEPIDIPLDIMRDPNKLFRWMDDHRKRNRVEVTIAPPTLRHTVG